MKVLVTGADGFIGSLVCRELSTLGHHTIPFKGNITNAEDLSSQIYENCGYDRILHLAGLSAVGDCEANQERAFIVNSVGTFLLVDLIRKFCPKVPLIFASSAQVYADIGRGAGTSAISETSAVDPSANTYARTKWIAEEYIRSRLGGPENAYTILRIFNHSHKSQRPDFFMPSIYNQIQSAKHDGVANLVVGNIDVYRDIGAVQDLVGAIAAVILRSERSHKIYNVCSGRPKLLRAIVMGMAEAMGVRVELSVDPNRIRANEPTTIVGSCQFLQAETLWRPQFGADENSLIKSFFLDFSCGEINKANVTES